MKKSSNENHEKRSRGELAKRRCFFRVYFFEKELNPSSSSLVTLYGLLETHMERDTQRETHRERQKRRWILNIRCSRSLSQFVFGVLFLFL